MWFQSIRRRVSNSRVDVFYISRCRFDFVSSFTKLTCCCKLIVAVQISSKRSRCDIASTVCEFPRRWFPEKWSDFAGSFPISYWYWYGSLYQDELKLTNGKSEWNKQGIDDATYNGGKPHVCLSVLSCQQKKQISNIQIRTCRIYPFTQAFDMAEAIQGIDTDQRGAPRYPLIRWIWILIFIWYRL